jgi:hypothetical protein
MGRLDGWSGKKKEKKSGKNINKVKINYLTESTKGDGEIDAYCLSQSLFPSLTLSLSGGTFMLHAVA